MRQLIKTIHNTYRTFKLLSNPKVEEILNVELKKHTSRSQIERVGDRAYHHRYFCVQVVD